MRLFIDHRTDYRFSEPQARLVQFLRLRPRSHMGQNVVDWRIDVDCDARMREGRDGFGNETAMLYVEGPIERIAISVTGEVLTEDRAGMVTGIAEPLPPQVFFQTTATTAPDAAIRALAAGIAAAEPSRLSQAHALNEMLHERLRFDSGTPADSPDAAAILAAGHGKARDLAQVYIAAARAMGLPARFVSGHVLRKEEGDIQQETAHAWAESWIEDYGWIGFDPSCGRCPDDAYVRVAIGLDYRDAAPLSGTRTGGGIEELEVGVRVGLSDGQAQG